MWLWFVLGRSMSMFGWSRCLGIALAVAALGCDHSITLTRILPESYSNNKADQALEAASQLLLLNDGSGDVQCGVIFSRLNDVDPFDPRTLVGGEQGFLDSVVDTDFELDRYIRLVPGYIKVVDELNRCGGQTNVNFIGCAGPTRPSMVIEDIRDGATPVNIPLEGALVAHEFGHTAGLGHRTTNNSTFLMNASIGGNSRSVSSAECTALRQPVRGNGTTSGSATVSAALAACRGAECTDPPDVSTQASRVPIEELARGIYVDSMPFAEAMTYESDEVPRLLAMLNDPSERAHWPMVASLIGIVGAPENAADLIEFIERRRSGRLSRQTFAAVRSSIVALGYLVERTGSQQALDYLWSASSPDSWSVRSHMRWTAPRGGDLAARNDRLAAYAIMALGLSGSPEAMAMLQARWSQLDRAPGSRSPARRDDALALMRQAMDDNARVAAIGLARYYGE